jgi:hypothetical protein
MLLTVRGLQDGETELKLKNAEVGDEANSFVKVQTQGLRLVVGEGGGGGGLSPIVVVGVGVLIAGMVAGGAFAVWSIRRRSELDI